MDNILTNLKAIFCEVLLCLEEELSLVKPYVDMGVDSILAIQISKLIKLKFGCDIASSELYNFISINDLANHLANITSANKKLENGEIFFISQEKKSSSYDFFPNEKIAIIGRAGRFPGAHTVEKYWENLLNRISSITPSTRWSDQNYKGGFLDSIDSFDADFFNISPKEALLMDPQQRLLLEVAQQAFEDAGYTKETLDGLRCGIFTTSLPGDYRYLLREQGEAYNSFSFAGNAVSILAGRISHFYNLKGPSVNIDTACSSSLVCIDLAKKSLLSGDCDLAFVGAASVFSTPEIFKLAGAANILSKKEKCRPFDAEADGFIPAEAVVGIVLKKLSDAENSIQNIYGTIEATLVGHDGFTNGLMSPNGIAQRDLIISTYKKKNISKERVAYIEAHGTGTKIGDPLEVNALVEAFKDGIETQERIYLGSCKANVGHALVASGLVSIVKVLESFRHGLIPSQINYQEVNPQIKLGRFEINTEDKDWPVHKPLAGISGFGFGGTNAHIVLAKYEKQNSENKIFSPRSFKKESYWVGEQLTDMGTKQNDEEKQKDLSNSREKILEIIREKISNVLGYALQDISSQAPIASFGLDSLTALQVLEPFKNELGSINPNILFSQSNLLELAAYLTQLKTEPQKTDLGMAQKRIGQKEMLNWYVEGETTGEPILLLPPLNTASHVWEPQIHYFIRKGYRLYIPHYPGHANTPFFEYNLESLADLIWKEFQENLNNKKEVNLVGWSLGGCLSLIIAKKYCQTIRKLVLVNTASRFDRDVFAQSSQLRAELENKSIYLKQIFKNTDNQIVDLISAGCSLDVLKRYYIQLQEFNFTKFLKNIKIPTLIVYGARDSVIEEQDALELQQIPCSILEAFDMEGHFIPLTAPYKFNVLLEKFLHQ